MLRMMGKSVKVRQVVEAVERCRKHRLHVAGSFIVGYPGETERDYMATKDLIATLLLDDTFVSAATHTRNAACRSRGKDATR